MPGIGLVFNPRAGGNRRDPGAPARLARQLGDHGVVAAPRSIDELLRVADDFKRQQIDVLGIAGGDGTNHVTITGFHQVYERQPLPTLALLRGGTMNTVANSLNIPKGRPGGLLDRLVERYLATPALATVPQYTMDIEGKLGFLWGLGTIPAFLDAYYGTGTPSPWTACTTLAKGIGSALVGGEMVRKLTAPVRATVYIDGAEQPAWPRREYFGLAAATVPDIGLGFRPFHRAGEVPGRVHLLGLHTTPIGFVMDLARIRAAQAMRPGKSTDALITEARVVSDTPTLRYMMDGDVLDHPSNEMVIRIGPMVRIATMN